jgi:homoserine dehydrogenase
LALMATGKTWRIGVAGLGTVGGGLLKLIDERPGFAPGGGEAVVTGVSARSRSRPRPVDISNMPWFDDPVALAASPDNDVFVELIGGSDGAAKVAVETALKAGKPVVTANKALIAEHGAELAALAEASGAPLLFEAAVMGGTPAVKMLREAMVGDEVEQVAGILNGTCNYILTEMEATGRPFADVLAEAQRLGYAEADPTMDVGGFDAAHKISILAALAFGCAPTYAAAEIEGVEAIEPIDIRMAKDLGYRIKLVASAVKSAEGVTVSVHPALAPLAHPLAQAGGPLNALFIEGRRIGRIFIQGPGAGSGPTAAAVAADIADVMTGARRPVFQAPAGQLKPFAPVDARRQIGRAYVRLLVRDEPGVIAAISETLAESGVSIDSFLQRPVEDAGGVPIVLTTHAAPEGTLLEALKRMQSLKALIGPPRMIRIARI